MGINQMTEPETEVSKRPSLRRSSDHDRRPTMNQPTTERPGLRTQSSFRGGLDKIQALAAGRPGMRTESSFRLDKIQGLISQANQAMTALSDHAITVSGLGKVQINLEGKEHDSFLNQSGHTANTMSSFDSSEGLTLDERVAAACSNSAAARRRAAEGMDSDVFRSAFNAPKLATTTPGHTRPAASARLSASLLTAPMLSSPQTRNTGEESADKCTSHITDTASSRLSRGSIHRRRSLNLPASKSMEVQAALRRANTASISYRRSLSGGKIFEEGKESSLKQALKLTDEKSEARSSAHKQRQPLVRNKTYDERYSSTRPHSTNFHRRSSLRDLKSIHEGTTGMSSLQKALHEDSKQKRASGTSHGRRINLSRRQSSRTCLYDLDADDAAAAEPSQEDGRRDTLSRRRSSRTCLYDVDADTAAAERNQDDGRRSTLSRRRSSRTCLQDLDSDDTAAERSQEDVKRRSSDSRRNRDEPKLRRVSTTTGLTRPSKERKSTNMKRSSSHGSPMHKQLDDDVPEKNSRSSRRNSSTGAKNGKVVATADHASKHRRSITVSTTTTSKTTDVHSEPKTRTSDKKARGERRGGTSNGRRQSSVRHCKADAKTIASKLAALEKGLDVESKSTPNTPAA